MVDVALVVESMPGDHEHEGISTLDPVDPFAAHEFAFQVFHARACAEGLELRVELRTRWIEQELHVVEVINLGEHLPDRAHVSVGVVKRRPGFVPVAGHEERDLAAGFRGLLDGKTLEATARQPIPLGDDLDPSC